MVFNRKTRLKDKGEKGEKKEGWLGFELESFSKSFYAAIISTNELFNIK